MNDRTPDDQEDSKPFAELAPRLDAFQKALGGHFKTVRVIDAADGTTTIYRRDDHEA